MTGPSAALAGLRVLDLTRVRAGPTCCRVLADFGADVVRVEAPLGADPSASVSGDRHGYDMLNLHRNKRSLTLNLKDDAGRDAFLRMVRQADVVVENFRPDVKERLRITYEDLAAINPAIILASISGFGQDGPYARRAGFDQIAQGMGGMMGVTGHPGQGPMRAGAAVADTSSGLYAAIGILTALQERTRSGKGQWVHTSLLQAQIALMDFQAARFLVDAEVPPQAGNDHPYVTPMGVVATRDGYLNLGVGSDRQWQSFCHAINKPDWADDPSFTTNKDRFAKRTEIWDMLAPVFAERSTADWVALLEEAGVPAGPIYDMDQVFADPQVTYLEMAAPCPHPEGGDTRLVAQPVTLSRTPASLYAAAPDQGADSDEVLGAYGFDTTEIAELRAREII